MTNLNHRRLHEDQDGGLLFPLRMLVATTGWTDRDHDKVEKMAQHGSLGECMKRMQSNVEQWEGRQAATTCSTSRHGAKAFVVIIHAIVHNNQINASAWQS